MTDDAPTTDSRWPELLADATAIAEEYRDDGWDAVVVDPVAVFPSEREERFGLAVHVSTAEYGLLQTLVEDDDVTFDQAEVFYRPAEGTDDDRRFALAVERDTTGETAICLPLTYSLSASRPVFERALADEQLLVHVSARPDDRDKDDGGDESVGDTSTGAPDDTAGDDEQWVTFSHDDPSLFLEEADVRAWSESDGGGIDMGGKGDRDEA